MRKTICGLLLTSSLLFSATYKVDQTDSTVGFDINHFGVSNVHGVFKDFKADIIYDEVSKDLTFFESIVKVNSVDTQNEERDDYIKQSDYFDVENYPNMKFEFVRMQKDMMFAYLTIKDTRKLVSFSYTQSSIANDILEFDLATTIKRSDFDIGDSSMFSLGNMVLSDELNIDVHVKAQKIN